MKTTHKITTFFLLLLVSISCTKDEFITETTGDELLKKESLNFNFDEFGRAHNDYLKYVHATGHKDARKRFEYGKTYTDPIFGSFDIGIDYNKLVNGMPNHLQKVESIINGNYDAEIENVSPEMTSFLNELATLTHRSIQQDITYQDFVEKLNNTKLRVKNTYPVLINLSSGKCNDGASMLAIISILEYSIKYWSNFDGVDDTSLARAGIWQRIKRALADAWGYVSAWTNNGDGSYSWDHPSALVNADCHSDQVYEN